MIGMVIPEPSELNITEPNSEDAKYESWVVDHPSPLMSFEEMISTAKGRKIVVFLDYDGTLSPIVEDPDLAVMSDTVYDFVQLNDAYYAGSHGMDIMSRRHRSGHKKGNEGFIFQPAKEFLPEIQKIVKELEEVKNDRRGHSRRQQILRLSHFRRAKEKDYPLVEERVKALLARHSRFRLTRGRKVLEIRPCINWNKGNALEYLLQTLGFAESSDVLPVYIGDDTTDEDAFKVIHKR